MKAVRAALWGVAGFAVGYLLPGPLRLPTLVYDPVARVVRFTADVGGVAMRYYGDLLWGSAAGLLAAALLWASRREERPVAVLTAAALALVALDVAFYLSRLLASV